MHTPPPIYAYFAWLLRRDWARWRALDPVGLQQRHRDWQRNAEVLEETQRAAGRAVERVVLDPQDFALWCRQMDIQPDSRARARFALELVARRDRQ